MKTKLIQFRISERLLERFDECLKLDGLKRSDILHQAVVQYVEEAEKRLKSEGSQ